MALLVLPAVFFLLWFQVWVRRAWLGQAGLTRRGAFVLAWLLFEALLLAITELSSLGSHFARDDVLAVWLAIAVVLLAASWPALRDRRAGALQRPRYGAWRKIRPDAEGTEVAAWLAVVGFYFGVLVYLALAYLPSNGDSLDYHLARVEHWIQDRSVAFFPAHFTAQVDYSPLTEYNLAHFHLLVGGDRLDGFVQLCAAVVCVVAVSEIARLLGGSRLTQVGAVVICITTPSLVLSATSTENNLFAASLGVCLVYVVLALPVRHWSFAVFAGLSVSLALMTKGTVLVLLGPVALVVVLFRILTETTTGARQRVKTVVVFGVVAVAVAAVVAGPFLYQDQTVFGSLDGPDAQAVLSTNLTWRAAGADIVRSTAANFMIGNGTSGPETAVSRFALGKFHRIYDLFGVPLDNWDYFVGNDSPVYFDAFEVRNFTVWDRSEDEGANPLQIVLICVSGVAATVMLLVRRRDRRLQLLVLMAATLTLGYLLLAGVARWQIFEVRFFIPLFVVWSPLVAVILARWSPWLLRVALVVLAVASLPQLLDNSERPLMRSAYGDNPLAPYFLDSTDRNYILGTAKNTGRLAEILEESSCRRLGIGNFVVIEYPVWVGLHDDHWNGEIQDVDVPNVTARYEDPRFHACAVLTAPTGDYVASEPGRIQLSFGPQLDLSVSPDAMRTVHTEVPGFSSIVPGVHVFPGRGWIYGVGASPDAVLKDGSIYLDASHATTVTVKFADGSGHPVPSVTVSPGAGSSPATVSDAAGEAVVPLSAGMTEVKLAAAGSSEITAVSVGAAPASP
ncbi:MAG TPA: Ig-like domain-containing protein [Acidimicrobiales bacterium]